MGNNKYPSGSFNFQLLEMDHEKPEVVRPQLYEYVGDHSRAPVTPDIEYAGTTSIDEPDDVENHREPQGESLW
jgi:yeast amino acid transporter